MSRSLDAARRLDPGFDPTQVASVGVDVRQNGYDETRGRVVLSQAARRGARRRAASSRRRSRNTPARLPRHASDARHHRRLRTAHGRRPDLHVQRRRAGLLPHAAHPARRRPPVRGSRRRARRAGHRRQQDAGAAVLGRSGERARQADPGRRRRMADRDRRRRRREVLAHQRGAAAVLLSAVPPVVPLEHDAAHAGRGPGRGAGRPGAGAHRRRSTAICRSSTPGR